MTAHSEFYARPNTVTWDVVSNKSFGGGHTMKQV